MPISAPHREISHFKSSCFCELFFKEKNIRKLIADAFSAKSAVVDRLHDNVGCDTACGLAVANHKGSIAQLADHTGCPIGSVQDRFDGCVVKKQDLYSLLFSVSTQCKRAPLPSSIRQCCSS